MKAKNTAWVKWVVLGVVLLALIAAWFFKPRNPLDGYDTETVQARNITTYYSFTGTLQPAEQETVTAERSGTVETVHVQEGDRVEEDDILVTYENGREITAPRSGEVGPISIEEGDEIPTGTLITTISDYLHLEVELTVPEDNIGVVEQGAPVNVRVSAADADLTGTVSHVGYTGTTVGDAVYYPVTVRIDEVNNESLRFGMSAEITLERDNVKNVPSVAVKSVQFDNMNQPYVYVQDEEDQVVKKSIQTGVSDGLAVQVTDGLKAGDVILIPAERLSLMDFWR